MVSKKRRKKSSAERELTRPVRPTLTGADGSPLKLSVISSSSEMPIGDLLPELWLLRTYALDIYPRGQDIEKALGITRRQLESESLISRFAKASVVDDIAKHVRQEIRRGCKEIRQRYGDRAYMGDFCVPAIATYFPEISSIDESQSEAAARALAGSVRLASQLKSGVVEFVLGRTVERCCRAPSGYEDSNLLKCEFIHRVNPRDCIRRVVGMIKEHVYEYAKEKHVRLAAEIEPGFSYVLNGGNAVEDFLGEVRRLDMLDCVGLNLDLGHMLMLVDAPREKDRITLEKARRWREHIFHAHASDNVGHHFGDIVPGTYHSLQSEEDGDIAFRPWVELCLECARETNGHSGHIAVELEGCDRLQWVQRSLLRLGYLVRSLA